MHTHRQVHTHRHVHTHKDKCISLVRQKTALITTLDGPSPRGFILERRSPRGFILEHSKRQMCCRRRDGVKKIGNERNRTAIFVCLFFPLPSFSQNILRILNLFFCFRRNASHLPSSLIMSLCLSVLV